MRKTLLLAAILSSATAFAADGSLNIINSSDLDIVALATAIQGSPWQPLALQDGMLRKGGTVGVDVSADKRCSRDFRVVFADASALVLRDFDTCRETGFDPAFYLPRMHRRHAPIRAGEA